jgi:glucan phosphoethanolaminetransferase (alkaline phosphatase superfamily)
MESRVEFVSSDELPFSVLVSRYFSPFWLFRDASKGGDMARTAAYRHNREMNMYLPTYMWRWAVLCAFALAAVVGFDRIQSEAEVYRQFFTTLGAGAGLIFICCFCFDCVLGGIYLRLRYE